MMSTFVPFLGLPKREPIAELFGMGFSSTAVAKLTGVSVTTVREWRMEGSSTATEDAISRAWDLLRVCEVLESIGVADVASLFETPLLPNVPVTPIDVYAAGRTDLVFDLAKAKIGPITLMDRFDPEWRERYRTDFALVRMSDGNRSLQMDDQPKKEK